MHIINTHQRILEQPAEVISKLLDTLSTKYDQIIAIDKWPRVKLDKGLVIGSYGGHGTIRYRIEQYIPGKFIQFRFVKPVGFVGIHQFEIIEMNASTTIIKHTLEMDTTLASTFQWWLVIRWLHDAFMEDAFDRIENNFRVDKKSSRWSLWVTTLRTFLASMRYIK